MIFFIPLSLLLFFLFFLILIFLLVVVIPIQAVRIALEKLGLSPTVAFFVFLISLIGSFINIPLAVKTDSGFAPAFSYLPLFVSNVPEEMQIIALNFGGALVPICLCIYLFFKTPILPTIFATIVATLVCHNLATVVP
ncbi:MAG TPA: DUF1614 domain-containing protein, partial [bacterium]|nr:DUF1614 domain-containing protein [bacterium]